ncbi:MAG: hypothetical protein RLN70_12005, partial [Rhodospirillaceae bacterium]
MNLADTLIRRLFRTPLFGLALVCMGASYFDALAQDSTVFPSPAILPTLKPPITSPAPQSDSQDDLASLHPAISPDDRGLFVRAMRETDRRRWSAAQSIAAKAESP